MTANASHPERSPAAGLRPSASEAEPRRYGYWAFVLRRLARDRTVLASGGIKANSPEMMLNVQGKERPLFAYTYQTIDDVSGNQDGQVQRGERVRWDSIRNIWHSPDKRLDRARNQSTCAESTGRTAGC